MIILNLGIIIPKMSIKYTNLSDILFSKTRRGILTLLFNHPQQSFYANEIMRYVNTGIGSVQRELEKLTGAGILQVNQVGNQKHYQANVKCPIYEELLSIVRKTFGIVDVLKQALLPVDKKIDVAFVYGSVAKGGESAKSDIDLMLIGNKLHYGEVMDLLLKVEGKLGRPVNPTIYTPKQIRDKLKSSDSFVTRVLKQDKLWIKGDQDAIKGIG